MLACFSFANGERLKVEKSILENFQPALQKNKLVQVLNTLTAEEMRQLDKFVRSPVHNKHEAVIQLFQYLRKSLGDEERLQKERVFSALFPGQSFDMQQVHYVSSYLLKVTEEFLAWQEWRKNEGNYSVSLVRALKGRRLGNYFSQTLEKAMQGMAGQPLRNSDYLHTSYLLEIEKYDSARMAGKARDFNLQSLADAQELFYLAEKLKNACVLLSHQVAAKTSYDMGLLEAVLALPENHRYFQNPATAIYLHAYRALSNLQDDESFQKLKTMLVEHRRAFQLAELTDLYLFAINHCIRRLNNGEQHFWREAFDIYRGGLEGGVLLDNGEMSPRTYSNIVISGLKMKEFEWVERFIHEYKNYLPDKLREGYFNYNLARLHYENKNYRQAMPLLLQMDYSDEQHACLSKILLAKMYFEQQEFESLSSLLQSFKTFIHRKKVLGYQRELYLQFIHFLGKLLQYSPKGNLREEIQNATVVAEKDWLLEQASK